MGLACRVGDTYPNQHLEVVVRCYLYRWKVARKPGESGMPSVRASHAPVDGSGLGFPAKWKLSMMEWGGA